MTDDSSDAATAALNTPKDEFWRRTPPAVFPSIFGFLGLGLAWRAAAAHAPIVIPEAISMIVLAIMGLLYMFCLAAYLSKISARPRVVIEDMALVPGRAGLSAMSLCLFLFAAAIFPLSPIVAFGALILGFVAHASLALVSVMVMRRSPQGFTVTPVWHLSFVGFVLMPLSAISLGYFDLSALILGLSVVAAMIIYAISFRQLSISAPPPPMRPMLTIHLAPVSLFTTVAYLLGWTWPALLFAAVSVALGAMLLVRVRFLIAGGFSPLWGAFTFPVAALTTALFTVSPAVPVFGWIALVPLTIGSLLTPYVAFRVLKMWRNGSLAQKTGAAVA